MATELLDDELCRLIKPLLPVRHDASAIPVGNGLMAAARVPADGSCCLPASLRYRRFWGVKIGPSPVDRRKLGSKHHLIADANGTPLACLLTSGNANDVTQLLPLVEAVPPIRGTVGRPRRRPSLLLADRGY